MTTNAGGQTVYSYRMSPSSSPTACTDSLQGHDAVIEFQSSALNVIPACKSFVQSQASGGDLWQETDSGIGGTNLNQVCVLTTDSGLATATVYDDGGEIYGQQACASLLAAGAWTESNTSATSTTTSTTDTSTTVNGIPTATQSNPITVGCPIDANTGKVHKNEHPTWCFWIVGPGTGAEQNPPPNPHPGATYRVDVGETCTWHDAGQETSGQVENYTCT